MRDEIGYRVNSMVKGSFLARMELYEIQVEDNDNIESVVAR